VIAAIVSAIVLAMVSPSGSDERAPGVLDAPLATPDPAATPGDTRRPTAIPTIVLPNSGITSEIDIEVTVDVPAEEIARKDLALVVLRDDVEVGRKERPKDDGEVIVPGVRLLEGGNELTAALEGPGGLGPPSEPITMTVDFSAPGLEITSPEDRIRTFDDVVVVAGRTEPGASVEVSLSTGQSIPRVASSAGAFDALVPLKVGKNEITVTSSDATTGVPQTKRILAVRLNGNPKITLKNVPDSMQRNSLPKKLTLVVIVTDTSGEPMEGAEVTWSLAGTGRLAETADDVTDATGKSSWPITLTPVAGDEPAQVGVTVTSPYGKTRTVNKEIEIS
jgi:hypothetical protein